MSKKILVAYFSATGTTKAAAEELAKKVNADLYEIKPEVSYTAEDLDWNNSKSRSSVEMNNPASRPVLANTDANVSAYDEILVGFPVWWYVAPTIINTFLENYDFEGKTVIAFATSGSSGIENCEKNLKKQYPKINWKAGRLLNAKGTVNQLAASVKNQL